jgi:hypothetical protein
MNFVLRGCRLARRGLRGCAGNNGTQPDTEEAEVFPDTHLGKPRPVELLIVQINPRRGTIVTSASHIAPTADTLAHLAIAIFRSAKTSWQSNDAASAPHEVQQMRRLYMSGKVDALVEPDGYASY